jgi:hypothetical protein
MSNVLKMLSRGGAVSAETDANFKQTVLLLHGDGTNGAQNNTFLDGSTNNFTITRNGNTTQGTFSPFSVGAGEFSNFFTGGTAQNGLSTTGVSFGTGNFTIECWIYPTAATTDGMIFDCGTNGCVLYQSGTQLAFFNRISSLDIIAPSVSTAISLNTWTHVAVVRTGTGSNQVAMYINGVNVATGTSSANFTSTTVFIGQRFAISSSTWLAFNGYISNVRSATTAVYTSAFTPAGPLTNITNTSLLTCQSNRFVDNGTANSGTGFAITRNGDVRVTPFSPFAPSAAYSASTNGGSGYFDGTGDYLSVPSSTAFGYGTGDFTIECWVYPLASTAQRLVFGGGDLNNLDIGFNPANTFQYYDGTVRDTGISAASRQWFHFAVSRISGTTSVYINGTRTNNFSDTSNSGTRQVYVAGSNTGTNPFNGYINDVRIIKGQGIYSGTTITIPNAPLTTTGYGSTSQSITGTISLLCNFTNAGIFDNTGKNNLETVGNAQIDTTTKKFGTGSMEFDGTTDYVVQPTSENYGYGTGDFTIEFWLYLNAVTGSKTIVSNLTSSSSTNPHLYMSTSSIRYYTVNADRITGGTLSTGQWYHIALVRASGSTRLYIDGTQSGSTYTDANNYGATAPLGIGTYWSSGSPVTTDTLNGFIDDLRITKGVARYPTEPFPTKAFPDL